MKRWNGWGDEATSFEIPEGAKQMLGQVVGPGTPPQDATLDVVLASVPESRLPEHKLVTIDPDERLRHCRGQSFPDWVAFRTGQFEAFPDGVAYPATDGDVRELIRWAAEIGAHLIPYGGGTSVLGHINPLRGDVPVLTVNLGKLSKLRHLDLDSHLATFGAGVAGPALEEQLHRRGFTLGHYPQSFELSTLGGWVVTRSSGQQSLQYGRIEDVFAGGRLESPAGTMVLPPHPASAAGPDLRHSVLGSEGRLGILTEATVRVSPLPEIEEFHSVFFPDYEHALTAAREIVQSQVPLSMLRVSTGTETATTLALAGHKWLVAGLERLLALRGISDEKCMLMIGATGTRNLTRTALKEALGLATDHGGWHLGQSMGRAWHKNRFHAPYARNTLWDVGYAIDTLETAIDWSGLPGLVEGIERSLSGALDDVGERVHVFTHHSHLYTHGANIYTTYLFRLSDDPDETLRRWKKLKRGASEQIVERGGTISHQHGVGTDHLEYLPAEKGPLGMAAIADLCHRFDPDGIMNPGKLIDTSQRE